MEAFGIFGILFFLLGICITIAPLIIWRNTNRTNRLLAVLLAHHGVKKWVIARAWEQSGSEVKYIFEKTYTEKNTEAFRQAAQNFSTEASTQKPPTPVSPTSRYCPACASSAPLDATHCPTCHRELPANAVHCPKCGHEITHQPSACPGCGAKYTYKGAAS